MTRISHPMDWCALETLAAQHGWMLVYRVARCEHGKTREQLCRDCENGYVQDTATYANVGNVEHFGGRALIAVSDDGCDVAYVDAGRVAAIAIGLRHPTREESK